MFYLNLNNPRSNANGNIGFRSALPSLSEVQHSRVLFQYGGDKGACFRSGPEGRRKMPSAVSFLKWQVIAADNCGNRK